MTTQPENLRHWNELCRTDPSHTKPFQRAGGFRGTAIKPMWSIKAMTEHFGPCGSGWGMEKPEFTTMTVGDEILVYCTVALWYREADSEGHIVYGVGGDKVAVKRKDGGVIADDEAFKKAYTDALSNAMKQIGVGADVHMGLFDDSKYVNELRQEFAAETREHTNGNGAHSPAAKPNGHSAATAKAPPPRKFTLLRENGEVIGEVDDPDLWCHDLRRELETPGAMVLALWQQNEPTASVIRDHFKHVQWADRKGTKWPAYEVLAAIVARKTPGIAA